MRSIRIVILLIPLLGIAALLAGIWDSMPPASREIFELISGRAFVIAFVLAVILSAWGKIARALRSRKASSFTHPVVTGARLGDGIGELTVAAGNSSDVRSKLILPRGSNIITIRANHLYRVEFDSPSVSKVESVARKNGYIGEVG